MLAVGKAMRWQYSYVVHLGSSGTVIPTQYVVQSTVQSVVRLELGIRRLSLRGTFRALEPTYSLDSLIDIIITMLCIGHGAPARRTGQGSYIRS